MPPGITWQEEDTDSDNGGDGRGSSSSSGGRRSPDLLAPSRPEDNRSLSPEEFGRMQDEFMALQMHHQDLLEERRRLAGGAAQGYGGPVPVQGRGSSTGSSSLLANKAASATAAFGRSLGTQMKAGTGAISALGVRGVASFQSSWTKSTAGPDGGGGAMVVEDDGASEEKEALRVEVELLRSRIRATMEEVDEFRTVAGDAQQVVAAAEQAARERTLVLPAASDLRQKVAEDCAQGDEEFEIVQGMDDEQLLRIGEAVLRLVNGDPQGSGGPEGSGSEDPEPEESEEDRILLQRKIEAQQEQLDRLLETFHGQQEQIIRLKDQLSGKDDPEKKKQVKEKLKNAEQQAEGLTRQLETSERGLRQSQELRTQLRTLAMQAVQRDQVIAEMRSLFEQQAGEVALLRERLLHSLEDLAGRVRLRAELRRLRGVPTEVMPPPLGAAGGHGAVGSTAKPSGAAKVKAPSSEPFAMSEMGVQAELNEDGSVVALAESVQLRMQIDDVRIEKALLEKRMAKQVQELKSLVEPTRLPGRPAPQPGASEEAGAGPAPQPEASSRAEEEGEKAPPPPPRQQREVVYHDISSDGEGKPEESRRSIPEPDDDDSSEGDEKPEYSAGMLYVQQVSDLEQRNDALRDELEAMHETERGLQAEIKEKTDLIAQLMQKANLGQPGGAATKGQERGFWRGRRGSRQSDASGEFRELEQTIQETQEANVRLRNDINVMADEFRRALSAASAHVPAKA